jgi:C1A family cysteine protease
VREKKKKNEERMSNLLMSTALLVLLAALVAAAGAASTSGNDNSIEALIKREEDEIDKQFATFMHKHAKAYLTVKERDHRRSVFKANLKIAADHQAKNPHAVFGVNKFSDLSPEEFRMRYRGKRHHYNHTAKSGGAGAATLNTKTISRTVSPTVSRPASAKPTTHAPTAKPNTAAPTPKPTTRAPTPKPTPKPTTRAPAVKLPPLPTANANVNSVDWRAKGAVTSVREQGNCAGCYAFSAAGNVEAQWFLKTGKLVELSEQQILSCDTVDGQCGGGLETNAWQWVISNNGGDYYTEASFPYTSGNGNVESCNTANAVVGATITGFQRIAASESAIASFMLSGGPVSVGVDSSSWQSYNSGIMTSCTSDAMDHSVLAVGFDDTHNPPYWIVKNSWGANWGEQGYIRVAKGSNQCLIASDPSVATV